MEVTEDERVIMSEQDRIRIVVWLNQVHRFHDMLTACDQVEIVDVVLP